MTLYKRIWTGLKARFSRQKLDAKMTEEMRSHVEMRTLENIKCRMDTKEARLAAQRQFGWTE